MAELVDTMTGYAGNFSRNIAAAFEGTTPETYIRVIAIVGAYILLRPYLIKLGAKLQAREHEKEIDEDEMAAVISPNSLRGQVEVPDDSDEETETAGADWGKKARKRQRQMIRRVLEAEERLRKEQEEDEEDKDIQEFLVD